MSENKHTLEPLRVGDENMCVGELVLSSDCHPIYDNDGLIVGITFDKEDARRIVACVNACYGMSDEQVSHGLVSASAFSSVVDQRDRLLSSLKRFADYPGAVCQADYDIARAAITSAKGGAA